MAMGADQVALGTDQVAMGTDQVAMGASPSEICISAFSVDNTHTNIKTFQNIDCWKCTTSADVHH